MSFESRNSLVIELEAAKEMKDREYAQQVRETIVAWDLSDKFENLTYPEELDCLREANGLEANGICYLMSKFCVEQGFEDDFDAVWNNLSSERHNRRGGSRWDLLDNYQIKGTEEFFGGVVLNGDEALAEIWFDDAICAYVPLN